MSTLHEVVSAGIGVQRIGAWLFSDDEQRMNQHMAQVRAIDGRIARDEAYWIQWHMRRPGVSRHVDPLPRPLRLLSLGKFHIKVDKTIPGLLIGGYLGEMVEG